MTNAIPEARQRLLLIADYLESNGFFSSGSDIRNIVSTMYRRRPTKIASKSTFRKTPTITPELRAKVLKLKEQGLKNREIATRTGLHDGGRVSEVLHGDR